MCGGDDHLAWKGLISTSLSYSWTTLPLCVDLFLPIQISISSVSSLYHTLSRVSCFVGLVLHSQYGFTILGQSRGCLTIHLPPPPPLDQTEPQASPYLLHDHRGSPTYREHTTLRVSDSSVVWDDLDSIPVASLPAKFRMPDIERRVIDDHHVSFIFEWRNPTLVRNYGVLAT
ncbi:hypothetical protein AAG906_022751 [Vitis piasezkii]